MPGREPASNERSRFRLPAYNGCKAEYRFKGLSRRRYMKTCTSLLLAVFSLALMLTVAHTALGADEAKIKANLAKLSPEDRKAAEAQKWCAIETENELGAMGTPIKVVLKGEPVFLCCKMCV